MLVISRLSTQDTELPIVSPKQRITTYNELREGNQKSQPIKGAWSHCVRGLSKLWPSSWQSRKGLRGEAKLHPVFSWGAVVIILALGLGNPADKRLLSVDPTVWRDPKKKKKRQDTNSALWERWAGSASDRTAALVPAAAHPLCHMPLRLAYTTGNALIGSWLRGSHRRTLLAEVSQVLQAISTVPLCVCVCRMLANLTALSCTSSIPAQQHLQIELALDSEWSERLKGQNEGEEIILRPVRPAHKHLLRRYRASITLPNDSHPYTRSVRAGFRCGDRMRTRWICSARWGRGYPGSSVH